MTPEQRAALEEYRRYVDEFTSMNPAEYDSAGNLIQYEMGPSDYENIRTDPRYGEYELSALRELENASRDGLTDRDRADLMRTENIANRANRGRIESIRQNMQARGMGGGGLDLVAQLQSAQDANEMEALRALEVSGMAQDRKRRATLDLGGMASNLQQRDFQQAAEKARARDAINQFNTQTRNRAAEYNTRNSQDIANRNVESRNQSAVNKFNAKTGMAGINYNAATDDYNQKQLRKAEMQRRKAGMMSGILGAAGGVAGGVLGTMVAPGVGTAYGAAAGAGIGSQLGGALGGYADGGTIPGFAPFEGDNPMNDIFTAEVSPGEVIIPRSIASNPDAGRRYLAAQKLGFDPMASKYIASDAGTEEPDPMYMAAKSKPKNTRKESDSYVAPDSSAFATAYPETSKYKSSLLDEYKKTMAGADRNLSDARDMQKYGLLAKTAGSILSDFSNSQKPNVILANRWDRLGASPQVIEPERAKFDGSLIDEATALGVKSAEDQREKTENRFFKEQQIRQFDKAENMNDPNSPESQSARAFVKSLLPSVSGVKGFEGFSAARLEKVTPMLMEKWKADRAQANANREYGLKKDMVDIKKSTAGGESDVGELLKGIPSRLWDNAIREKKAIDEYNKVKGDAFSNVEAMSKIDLIGGYSPSAIGGTMEKYNNLKANISAAIIGKVPGIRSDKDYENIVVPNLPQRGDTPEQAADRVRIFRNWLESQAPESPTLSNFGKTSLIKQTDIAPTSPSGPRFFNVMAPNGQVKKIPEDQLQDALTIGKGRLVE